jgi:hypothetical protein
MIETVTPYNVHILTERYEIKIDLKEMYGWFEHNDTGTGGGLWFVLTVDGVELIDYDGVAVLPREVVLLLRKIKFIVGEDF